MLVSIKFLGSQRGEGKHGPETGQQKSVVFWERKTNVAESNSSSNTIALKMVSELEVNMSHSEQSRAVLKDYQDLLGLESSSDEAFYCADTQHSFWASQLWSGALNFKNKVHFHARWCFDGLP